MTITKGVFGACVAAGVLAQSPAAEAIPYSFITLTDPNAAIGTGLTIANGINNAGAIVGYYTDAANAEHGFLYTSGSFATINVPGQTNTIVSGLSDTGQIVGRTSTGFSRTNGVIAAVSVPGASTTSPAAVNTAGTIVGNFITQGYLQSFVGKGGNYQTIVPTGYPPFTVSQATGINNAGEIVGTANNQDGFTDSNGVFTRIDVPGAAATYANGINDLGEVVGFYQGPGPNSNQGFLDNNGALTTIDVPGAVDTEISGINNTGEIIGEYATAPGVDFAFLATPVSSVAEPSALAVFSASVFALGALVRRRRSRRP